MNGVAIADAVTYLSFPGLGIGPFHIDRVAFTLFGKDVMWYGVLIAAGMLLGVLYAMTRAKIERVKSDDLIDLALWCIIAAIVGARLYYVAFEFDQFYVKGDILETLKNIVSVWEGGLAIYGGIILGCSAAYVFARVKKIRFATLLDIGAPAILIGQIVGRWGNFFNAEAHGGETESFIRMGIHKATEVGGEFYSTAYYHPTFLYESLWNLVGLVIIAAFYKKKRFHGQVFVFYAGWYGFGRAIIEGLRTDSLWLGGIRISQLVGAVCFLVCAVLMILGYRRPANADESAYLAVGTGETSGAVDGTDLSECEAVVENASAAENKAVFEGEEAPCEETPAESEKAPKNASESPCEKSEEQGE